CLVLLQTVEGVARAVATESLANIKNVEANCVVLDRKPLPHHSFGREGFPACGILDVKSRFAITFECHVNRHWPAKVILLACHFEAGYEIVPILGRTKASDFWCHADHVNVAMGDLIKDRRNLLVLIEEGGRHGHEALGVHDQGMFDVECLILKDLDHVGSSASNACPEGLIAIGLL